MASPSEINDEKPIPLLFAQSRTVVQIAADCDTKAILPMLAPACAKLAFNPIGGNIIPRLLGPNKRMP